MPPWVLAVWWLLIVAFAAVAAWTDWRSRKVYNWLTLPGMIVGLLGQTWLFGGGGAIDALAGWLALGGVMVLGLALFPHVGGGDVKLMAMLGAMLGLEGGLETLLWTCTVAVIEVLALLTWKCGVWKACAAVSAALFRRPTSGSETKTPDPVQDLLTDRLQMAPAALVAVLIVLGQRLGGDAWS